MNDGAARPRQAAVGGKPVPVYNERRPEDDTRFRHRNREGDMKSVLQGLAAAIVIAVVAGVVLNTTGQSSANKFTTSSTRL